MQAYKVILTPTPEAQLSWVLNTCCPGLGLVFAAFYKKGHGVAMTTLGLGLTHMAIWALCIWSHPFGIFVWNVVNMLQWIFSFVWTFFTWWVPIPFLTFGVNTANHLFFWLHSFVQIFFQVTVATIACINWWCCQFHSYMTWKVSRETYNC